MNNQEAKFILSSYRPNGADARDALFQEALQQVRQDPAVEGEDGSRASMTAS